MIELTPFTSNDFERLIAWIDNKELLITIGGNYFSYPLTAEQLEKYLNDEKSHSFNILDTSKNKIIGHAELINSGNKNFKIDKLIVGDKQNRGKGIGEKVMHKLVEFAFTKLQAEAVELNVFDWNKSAIRCYEKTGFIVNQNKISSFKMNDGEIWIALNMTINNQVTKLY